MNNSIYSLSNYYMPGSILGLPGGAVQERQETWVWYLGWEDPLKRGMAIHVSILAWRIPWAEEPGSHSPQVTVRHNWAIEHTHTHTHRQYTKPFKESSHLISKTISRVMHIIFFLFERWGNVSLERWRIYNQAHLLRSSILDLHTKLHCSRLACFTEKAKVVITIIDWERKVYSTDPSNILGCTTQNCQYANVLIHRNYDFTWFNVIQEQDREGHVFQCLALHSP